MAKVDLIEVKGELVNFIRNQDILSIATRGVTTVTEEFNGDNSTTTFNLANSTSKNIRTVTVDAAAQTFGVDFTFDLVAATVTFIVAPPSGTDNVDVTYDFGPTDKIFPDFPMADKKLSDFPRIAVELISGTTAEYALNADGNVTDYIATMVCYSESERQVENMVSDIRQALQDNKKNFFFFPFITPTAMGPPIVVPWGKQKIFQRNQDANVRFIYEQ